MTEQDLDHIEAMMEDPNQTIDALDFVWHGIVSDLIREIRQLRGYSNQQRVTDKQSDALWDSIVGSMKSTKKSEGEGKPE